MRRARILVWTLLAFFAAIVLTGAIVIVAASRETARRQAELDRQSETALTRSGQVQYAVAGDGPPVLVVHGAGGGFDQGLLIARTFGGAGVQWIAPSRFGYLASDLPEDASTAAQADAFADLLDHLDIERVSILAFSGGVPPALQFAERHADRTECLALLSSAPFTPHRAPQTGARPLPDWAYQALLGNDALYWSLTKLAPRQLEAAFDARPDLRTNLSREEEAMVRDLVANFMPASQRLLGVGNETAAIDPNTRYALERITAPTLVVHARDDQLNPFSIGEDLAARLANARFIALESGGHLLLGHQAEVRESVAVFLANCSERR